MMSGGMVGGLVLMTFLLFGFAYIVWVLAAREAGGLKLIGQVIAVVIAVLALLILVYGSVYGGRMHNMMGRGMMGPGMWDKGMMQNPEMQKMMQERMMQNYRK